MAAKATSPAPQKAAPKTTETAQLAPGMTPTLQKPEEGAAPMTPKNFRNHPDMENFFRFIYENDLRLEALDIIDQIIAERQARRNKKPSVHA